MGLFQDHFYSKFPTDDGGYAKRLDKDQFFQWICEDRKNPDDFEKFDRVVKILKEFVKANQLPID